MEINTLGLMLNAMKPEAEALVPEVLAACAQAGVTLLAAQSLPCPAKQAGSVEDMLEASDALLVLGGDGTILHAVACMNDTIRPILGVNLGTLGFLAECAPGELRGAVLRLSRGEYRLEQRMLLEALVEGKPVCYTALNDVVLSRGSFARVIQVDTYVDGALAARYTGDGTVVASPTGSTAYSLSAGGPVVAPDMACFVLAPICAHTLSSRPLVVSSDAHVRLVLRPRDEDGGMLLSVDGVHCKTLHGPSVLDIRRASHTLPFIRFGGGRFFESLRGKLSKWGGGLSQED